MTHDRIRKLRELLKEKELTSRKESDLKRRLDKLDRVRKRSLGSNLRGFIKVEDSRGHFYMRRVSIPLKRIQLGSLSLFLSDSKLPDLDRLVFLDNESIGISGGVGSFAFLVGVLYLRGDDGVFEQYFLSDPSNEYAFLSALSQKLDSFEAVVTFNGKSFDVPQLENRMTFHGINTPSWNLHMDLLHVTRRLYRGLLESFTLQNLEKNLLKKERRIDIPSSWVPRIYRGFLKGETQGSINLVFIHNQEDVVTLYSLMGHVVNTLKSPENAPPQVVYNLSLLNFKMGKLEEAQKLLNFIPDVSPLHYPAKRLRAYISKRLKNWDEALAHFLDWYRTTSDYLPLEEVAKIYEHRMKNPVRALELLENYITKNWNGREEIPEDIHRRLNRLKSKVLKNGGLNIFE